MGFAAIGSGSPTALDDLYFHECNWTLSFEEASYRILSAKFMAEKASDVGDSVFAVYTRQQQKPFIFEDAQIEKVRLLWEKEGRARLPKNYEERLKEILKSSSPLPNGLKQPS